MSINMDALANMRLLQILSPVSPVGSYSYSQGLEWAVNEDWVNDEHSFRRWISEQISCILSKQELPLLRKIYTSVDENDSSSAQHWCQLAVAVRETAELRDEERNRAESMLRVVKAIEPTFSSRLLHTEWSSSLFMKTPLFSLAWFSVKHNISLHALLVAFAHNWLENSLVTGVKVIPLGQSAGQRMLFELADELVYAIEHSLSVSDDGIGVSLPAMSMASSAHETQYSRVYRS